MDKLQKLDYLSSMESYLEQNEIYELLGDLLKEIVIHRPKDPLDFIIEKLKQQPGKIISFLIL
jgi:adenylate kinase